MNLKRCSKCKEIKPVENFYKSNINKNGVSSRCKECAIVSTKSWLNKNRPSNGTWKHRLSGKDPESKTAVCSSCGFVTIKLKGKVWSCENSIKEQKRKWKGIRVGFKEGICPICNRYSNKLVYDHDHKSGEFRGYICFKCNVGLGMFLDDTISLENAIKYLNKKTPTT